MNRYVIEIKPEYEDSFKGLMILGAKDSNLFVDTLAVDDLEQFNSDYINEHYGELQDMAYQRGIDDAWEAARKIVTWPDRSLVNSDTFDLDPGENIFTKYSASSAIEKLKAYEEQKEDEEIKVGDVVAINHTDRKGIVTRVDGDGANVLQEDGQTGYYLFELLKKTDKHDSSIEAVLKRISDEDN